MTTSRRRKLEEPVPKAEEEFAEEPEGDIEEDPEDREEDQGSEAEAAKLEAAKKRKVVAVSKTVKRSSKNNGDVDGECRFDGDKVPMVEAQLRWPHRYSKKNGGKQVSVTKIGEDDGVVLAKCHYLRAKVDGITYYLYDNAYVKAAEGEADYIGRILEFFETHDKQLYFSVQWFFRTEDTVIKDKEAVLHDPRRVFLSDEKDDNLLDCIVSKVNIVRATPNIDLSSKEKTIPFCNLYYDMSFSPAYSTFANLSPEDTNGSKTPSSLTEESDPNLPENKSESESEFVLLDLYSGCGGMSTGLCLGARSTGLNLQTRWAVDLNPYACESLKLNHPNTEVRNEKAEDFLSLLHEWDKLCRDSGVLEEKVFLQDVANSNDDDTEDLPLSSDEFEVGKILGIRFEKTDTKESGLKFKVRWKGYGPDEDTWEPVEGLSTCEESIQEFVRHGYRSNILPLPGRVDVICGGPPCQGISGFNRFRNVNEPLADPKNYQLKVFMDIVDFLKPKYVLMENVVDILKFAGGCLGRFALSRLVAMNYQARLGILPAGSFGVPQFRLRAFLWGASPTKKLPQFPLPTHNVIARNHCPSEFESNVIPYKENEGLQLERALVLKDALSDLPAVGNDEARDEMEYGGPPITDFQKFIRLSKKEMMHSSSALGDKQTEEHKLFDHRPLKLKNDDYLRVCQIPKKKGANFRNLRGVKVGTDNIVYWDPDVERVKLPSGKPLVPDYAMKFVKGKSLKPFGRLWWDEIIATVVTRAEPHNQAVIHPIQDRVLTVREDARLQGFPDYYKLCGPIKERYIQVGNAVAVPVARALGYALGVAFQGKGSEEALLELPSNFHKFEAADVVVDS